MTRFPTITIAMLAALSMLQADVAGATPRPALSPSVTIRFDPSDLQSERGVARVYWQVRQAARSACEGLPLPDRWSASARHACRLEALESAIRRLGHAGLSAHHRACQRRGGMARCDGLAIAAS